jgi:hypothetical protein
MPLHLYCTEVEGYDDAGACLFKVRTADLGVCEVTLHEGTHDAKSWAETAAGITQAIGMLKLEEDPRPQAG